jgi:hypothetical protein
VVCDIRREDNRLSPQRFDFVAGAFQALFASCDQADMSATFGKGMGDRSADSG